MNKLAARVAACLFLVATEPAFIRTLDVALPVTSIRAYMHQKAQQTLSNARNKLKILDKVTLKVKNHVVFEFWGCYRGIRV